MIKHTYSAAYGTGEWLSLSTNLNFIELQYAFFLFIFFFKNSWHSGPKDNFSYHESQ